MFVVGNSRIPADRSCIKFASVENVEASEIGDCFQRWQYFIEKDADCVAPSQLERWRWHADTLGDRVVDALDLARGGKDALAELLKHMASEKRNMYVEQFYHEMTRLPPEHVNAAVDGNFKVVDAGRYNHRRPPPTLVEGQAVFTRYSSPIFLALMHYSLTVGFSSKRITSALKETNYLTSDDKQKTYIRLIETTQFIMDCMEDMTIHDGIGWKSCVRLRLLHAQTRCRITARKGLFNTYDADQDGLPLNLEDMVATLGSFSVAPIWSMRRVGINLSQAEEMAYLSVWRHIGYYLGIDPAVLARHFSTMNAAEKLFASTAFHLFADLQPVPSPDVSSSYRILLSVANRPPNNATPESLAFLSRQLTGDELADYLALPNAQNFQTRLKVSLSLFSLRYLIIFGRYYPRRAWDLERQLLLKQIIVAIIAWQLGSRRTKFAAKDASQHGEKLDFDHEELPPSVILGKEAGQRMKQRYYLMLGEMLMVSGGLALSIVCMSCKVIAWLK